MQDQKERRDSIDENASFRIRISLLIFSLVFLSSVALLIPIDFSKNKELFQEFHKAMIGLSAILFAFTPAFFVFTYSSPAISEGLVRLKIKDSVNNYFKYSITYSALLLASSVLGIFPSYLPDYRYSFFAALFLTAVSLSSLIISIYWTFLFGRLVYKTIKHFIK